MDSRGLLAGLGVGALMLREAVSPLAGAAQAQTAAVAPAT